MYTIAIPEPSLVLLIGPSGSGKSTFAAKHFIPTEVISSDRCRAMLVDDEADQSITGEAFAVLHHIARVRLEHDRLTVIDATNLTERSRQPLRESALRSGVPTIALVFHFSLEALHVNNKSRGTRIVPSEAIDEQQSRLKRAIPLLEKEGYRAIYYIDESSVSDVVIERTRTLPG